LPRQGGGRQEGRQGGRQGRRRKGRGREDRGKEGRGGKRREGKGLLSSCSLQDNRRVEGVGVCGMRCSNGLGVVIAFCNTRSVAAGDV
jgi:hypothetical protein